MRKLLVLTLLLAACEKQDNSKLEDNDEKMFDKLEQVSASQAQGATSVAELEKKVDILSKQVAVLEAKVNAQGAVPPRVPSMGGHRRQEPDAKDVYAVPVAGDPMDGPADALVTIVEGYEYACPYCEKVRATLAELRRIYGDDLRVVKKMFIVHPQVATDAAMAACAAAKQGKFAAMDTLIWDKAFAVRKFDAANLEALAQEAHLDVSRYKRDIAGDCPAQVRQDQDELTRMGQGATPTFFINGHYMSGAQPVSAFQTVIDEQLKQAKDRVAAGTSRADYYQSWVLDRGLPSFISKPTTP